MADWLSGQLLVASPTIGDPTFTRSVVLVIDHDRDGALGIVLNRPTEMTVVAAVPTIAAMFDEEDVVHEGGPVQPESLLTVAEFRDPAEAALLVLGRVGMVRSDEAPLCPNVTRARAYAGYAGWGPGQLDRERAAGDWMVVSARPDDLFREDADRLWLIGLERLGGAFARLANGPVDASLN